MCQGLDGIWVRFSDLVFTLLSVEMGVVGDSSRAIFPAHSLVFTSRVKEGIP